MVDLAKKFEELGEKKNSNSNDLLTINRDYPSMGIQISNSFQ